MDIKNFLSKIKKTGGCWIWEAQLSGGGYGRFKVDGTPDYAHRVSWRHFNKKKVIPLGKQVMHKCDNRKCVNPKHLILGTPKDNTQDMINKGRCAVGSKGGQSKLTEEVVIEIRAVYETFLLSNSQLGKLYGVCAMNINRIINRKIWKHC